MISRFRSPFHAAFWALLLTVIPSGLFGGAGDPAPSDEPAQVRLIADVSSFSPGEKFKLGVLFTIEDHWHTYWHSAREGGIGTQVAWGLPDGWIAGPVQWPIPKRFILPGPLVAYGYEKQVLLVSEVTVPEDFSEGSVTIEADLSWLVCKETCLIGEAKPQITLSRGKSAPSPEAKRFQAWAGTVPRTPERAGISVSESYRAGERGGEWQVTLRWPEGARAPDPDQLRAFPFDFPGGELDEGRVETDGHRAVFTFRVEVHNPEFRAERLGAVITWSTENGPSEKSETRGVRVVREKK